MTDKPDSPPPHWLRRLWNITGHGLVAQIVGGLAVAAIVAWGGLFFTGVGKGGDDEPGGRVELGPGHFTEYCQSLGWGWVEYREKPQPGAYCVKQKSDMLLTASQRDAGCRWRYDDPRALHYFKNKSNYCYSVR